MTDVVNPKSASPDQLLPYHKKISAEGKALMKCFISYTYMVLKASHSLLCGCDASEKCHCIAGMVTNVSCVQISAQDAAEGNGFLQLKQTEMHGNLRGRDCGREVLTVISQNAGSAGFPQRFPDAARLRGSAGNENSG